MIVTLTTITTGRGANGLVLKDRQLPTKRDLQQDIYEVGFASVTSNALTVLITLAIVGAGLSLLLKNLTKYLQPKLEKYFEQQGASVTRAELAYKEASEAYEDSESSMASIKSSIVVLNNDISRGKEHLEKLSDKMESASMDLKEIKIYLQKRKD